MNNSENSLETHEEDTQKTRELNDLFRLTFVGGRVMLTSGISSLPAETVQNILARVQKFDDFSSDNDPRKEHDFGNFTLKDGTKVFWKIDYYNESMTCRSENPANPKETIRVLTVMLADEY